MYNIGVEKVNQLVLGPIIRMSRQNGRIRVARSPSSIYFTLLYLLYSCLLMRAPRLGDLGYTRRVAQPGKGAPVLQALDADADAPLMRAARRRAGAPWRAARVRVGTLMRR